MLYTFICRVRTCWLPIFFYSFLFIFFLEHWILLPLCFIVWIFYVVFIKILFFIIDSYVCNSFCFLEFIYLMEVWSSLHLSFFDSGFNRLPSLIIYNLVYIYCVSDRFVVFFRYFHPLKNCSICFKYFEIYLISFSSKFILIFNFSSVTLSLFFPSISDDTC